MKASVILEAEQDVELTVEGNVFSYTVCFTAEAEVWYDPGKVTGPWEDSYPPDGECNISSIVIDAVLDSEGDPVEPSDWLRAQLKEALNESRIEELCWESAQEEWDESRA